MVQVMVTHAPKDCNLTFQKTEKVILDSLQRITTLHRSKGHQLPYLCGVLKIIGHEVTPEYAFNMLRDIAALLFKFCVAALTFLQFFSLKKKRN